MLKTGVSRLGFSLLEVMVAMTILTVMLMAIYQSFSTSLFMLSSTTNLWQSMVFAHNELLRWERSTSTTQSIAQGEFQEGHPLAGYRWLRRIEDVTPFPNMPIVTVRKVEYQLKWNEAGHEYSYSSEIYIRPN